MNPVLSRLAFVFSGIVFSHFAQASYPQVVIHNFADVPATANIIYSACRSDSIYLEAATRNQDNIAPSTTQVSAGHWENNNKHKWKSDSPRGACLIKRIDVSFHGGNYAIDSYESSGTSYSQFTIVQRTASRFRVMSLEEMKAETGDHSEKSPGFMIHNRTEIPLTVSLDQIGCLYYVNNLLPGKTFDRNTGAVWFTIKARAYDQNHPINNQTCAKPIEIMFASAIATMVAPGLGDAFMGLFAAGDTAAVAAAGTVGAEAASAVGAATVATATATTGSVSAALASPVGVVVTNMAKAAAVGGLSAVATQRMEANTSTSLAGQYAGPPYPFRCERKPEYEIIGGPKFGNLSNLKTEKEVQDAITNALTGDNPLKIRKINNCG